MTTKTHRKIILLVLFQFITISMLFSQVPSSQAQTDKTATQFPEASTYTNTNLTYTIIDAPNNTFSYDVFAAGRLMIHQSSVPGMPVNEGFKTK